MKMSAVAVAVVLLSAPLGYSGGKGEGVYTAKRVTRYYVDESLYKDACQLAQAGTRLPVDRVIKESAGGRIAYLEPKARFRTVEVSGCGAKIAILSGKREGSLGWMLSKDLATADPG